jgi:hypothetical protein
MVLVVVAALSSSAAAQVTIGPQGPVRMGESTRPAYQNPREFHLTVTPAPEPAPTFQYALYPRSFELTPGNSVPYWYRALLHVVRRDAQGGLKSFHDNLATWLDGPLAEMPLQDVRTFLLGITFQDAERATLREKTDWSVRLYDLRGEDTVNYILADVQEARSLARLLALRARLAMAEGRYNDAIATLRINYRLAQDVAQIDILIPTLVGIAITAISDLAVLDLIDAPRSPNLYWALATRPRPQFDLRRAAEVEMTLPTRMFAWLADANTRSRSSEDWRQEFRETVRVLNSVGGLEPLPSREYAEWQFDLLATVMMLRGYTGAKRDLVAWGDAPADVEALPVGQAIARHQTLLYRRVTQNMLKGAYLSLIDAREIVGREEQRLSDEGLLQPAWRGHETFAIVGTLLPAWKNVIVAALRREVFLSGLQVIEAVRMHAAGHDGQLPQSLDEITAVPVPKNPVTGQPFPYRIEGQHAQLEIESPDPVGSYGWHIDLTVEKP